MYCTQFIAVRLFHSRSVDYKAVVPPEYGCSELAVALWLCSKTGIFFAVRAVTELSVQFTFTGLSLKCQYRLHSQACSSSVSTVYTHRPAAQVSVQVTLAGAPLNMPIDITHTQAYPTDLTHINYMRTGTQPILSCFWPAKLFPRECSTVVRFQ